ncbi:MAG: hypothetical protein ABSA23_18225 [Anaerolineales bacterium]|jgi:hypothetical protein
MLDYNGNPLFSDLTHSRGRFGSRKQAIRFPSNEKIPLLVSALPGILP